ncbi:MAG: universal stress protein [Actinomycetota bacterium]|nr:universal stress protein [Actinomycetota bacterium]
MTVVVGYVPTPEGRTAVTQAGEEARLRGTRLLVLNASRGAAPGDPALATPGELAELTATLRGAGVEHEIRQSQQGPDVAQQLLAAAAEPDVRLLVIGLPRRSAVGKLLLGSTAQQVLLQAPVPVLAVHADDEA